MTSKRAANWSKFWSNRFQAVADFAVTLAIYAVGAVELVVAEVRARLQGRPGPLTVPVVVAVAVTLTACGPAGNPAGVPDPTVPLVTIGPIPVPGTGEGTGALDARTPGSAR